MKENTKNIVIINTAALLLLSLVALLSVATELAVFDLATMLFAAETVGLICFAESAVILSSDNPLSAE